MTKSYVLWITSGFPHTTDPSNGVFHRTLVQALARRGLNVEVVAPVPWAPAFLGHISQKWDAYRKLEPVYNSDSVIVRRPRYLAGPGENIWGIPHLSMAESIKRLRLRRPELIHAHFSFPMGALALALGRRWNTPVVLTLHGSDVNTYPDLNWLSRRRFVSTVQNADVVLGVSGALVERTQHYVNRKIVHLPIGVDLNRFRTLPSKMDARRQLGLSREGFLVLYVGRLVIEKGIRELLQSLQQLASSSITGVFVGDGPLRAEVRNAPGVVAPGVEPNERVAQYMAAADVLVLPSYSEGLPTVLVEAGAAGLPVIASSVGGVVELLGSDRGHLVAPAKVPDLTEAIRTVHSDYAAAQIRAGRFQQHVRRYYDVDANADELLSIYRATMSGR